MTLLTELARTPWEQAEGESDRAFHAFVAHYLPLPSWDRSLVKAYRSHQAVCKQSLNPPKWASPLWAEWRFKYNWVERAAAHDADLAARARQRQLVDIEQMQARHAALAVAVQNQIILRLQQLIASGEVMRMTPVALARLLDVATTVERRSRGLAETIIAHQTEATSHDLLDLGRLSPAELSIFESLVARADPAAPPNGGNDAV